MFGTGEWRSGKRSQVSPGANSGVLPRLLRHSTLCCRSGTRCLPGPGQLLVTGSAGGQERYRKSSARATCGWVSMCACSKKDGSARFAKRKHCVMVQSGLTRAREQNHSFTSGGMCVLRRFVQGSAGLPSPAPSPLPRARRQQVLRLRPSRCPPARQRVLRLWSS